MAVAGLRAEQLAAILQGSKGLCGILAVSATVNFAGSVSAGKRIIQSPGPLCKQCLCTMHLKAL